MFSQENLLPSMQVFFEKHDVSVLSTLEKYK